MPVGTASPQNEPLIDLPEFARQCQRHCQCPCCGGFLIPLARGLRCERCSFTICEGCEGVAWED
jgi:hypothetical protein